MITQNKIKNYIKSKQGISVLSLIISLTITSAIVIPTTNWLMSASKQNNQIENNLFKLTMIEDRLTYLNNLASDEIKARCDNNSTISNNIRNKYLLMEQYYTTKNSNNTSYKVKFTLTDKTTNKKYVAEKTILTSQNEPFVSTKYIDNLSYPSHKLSVKYDASAKKVKWYVDGKELHPEEKNKFEEGNGYAVFDNGFMIQWGKTTSNTIIFPKPFPNKCFNLIPTVSAPGTPSYVYNFNNANANIETYGSVTNWVALGY